MIYDPFQIQAIEAINQGHSVIVSAPTGAGKTVIAEHVIQECMRKGEKVIYTAPIKALSNQKFRDFHEQFPDQVGILTGDISLNAQAPTLIMTTEIFRNKILEEPRSLEGYSWIIFDEIHYLDDWERGTVWEESLIFLPSHMNLLGLSATIPNINELAGWLSIIHHKEIKVIVEHNRPVPLHFYYQCQGQIFDSYEKLRKTGFHSQETHRYYDGRFPQSVRAKPSPPLGIIEHLDEENLLPCIYFVFSRRRTEQLAEEVIKFDFLNEDERKKVRDLYDHFLERFDLKGEPSAYRLRPFIERGIAYHHAGMLPTLKEVVERLFTSRLIKVIFTTETFALGINMPARSVIFDELRKFYGISFGILKTRDFYQMAGRAGRRSIDTEGFVFCRINPHYMTAPEVHKIIYSQPEKVLSHFNASYATLLNLYLQYGEELYEIYPRSFHHYQRRKEDRVRAVDQLKTKVRFLKDQGYIRKNKLTEKGHFATKVYGYELILSELYLQGVLEKLSLIELGVLSLAVVFEPRKGAIKPPLTGSTRNLEATTKNIFRPVLRNEKRFGITPESKRCYFHLAPAMEGWLKNESFDRILQYSDADEGEMVRYFRMSIQILREVMEAPVSDEMKDKILQLIRTINRDVIDSEKQLRS